MARLNRFILEYKECIRTTGLTLGGTPSKRVVHRFVHLFKTVEDPRAEGMIDYPLCEILLIAFLALLSDCSRWTEIEDFGNDNRRWLKKFLKLKNGVPSHDTYQRVFSLIDPAQLQEAITALLLENMTALKQALGIKEDGYRHICIDGKEERGTGRKYGTTEKVSNLQTLHIYDASNSICLVSEPIAEKTNEIPVAQKFLGKMNLKGCVVTFDSLHTQVETIRLIAEQKGDYVGGLKGNQGTLLSRAEDIFTSAKKEKLKTTEGRYYREREKAHNQVETRHYYLVKTNSSFNGAKEWKNLRSFICCKKHICHVVTGKETVEIRFYISSLADIELCAEAIREHWAVEGFHWHLDCSFEEDENTTMDKGAFCCYSMMNKMALALCKLVQPFMGNRSIRRIRKSFARNPEKYLAILLNNFDAEQLKEAMSSQKA